MRFAHIDHVCLDTGQGNGASGSAASLAPQQTSTETMVRLCASILRQAHKKL
jgi:hypothetical protein